MAVVLPLEPHRISLDPSPAGHIAARNTPPAGFKPEEEVDEGGPPSNRVPLNAAASDPMPQDEEGDEFDDCEEEDDDHESDGFGPAPPPPNNRAPLNAAASDPMPQDEEAAEWNDCEEEDEEDDKTFKPVNKQAINAAASGPGDEKGGHKGGQPSANPAQGSGNDQGNGKPNQGGDRSQPGQAGNGGQQQPQSPKPSDGPAPQPPQPPPQPPQQPSQQPPQQPPQPPQASTSSSAPNSASEAKPTGSKGDNRVGLAWNAKRNDAGLSSYVANGLQWWHNWGMDNDFPELDIEFIPTVWAKADVSNVGAAKGKWPASTKHVFSFNEPDIKDGQAGQFINGPAEAATLHKQVSDSLGSDYWLGTPAVSTGVGWLKEWRTECEKIGGCRHDFITLHFYGRTAQELIDTIKEVHKEFGQDDKKIWVNEWGCHVFNDDPALRHSCSVEEADALMTDAIKWFRGEGKDIVERWAWFGAFKDMKNWDGKHDMDANRIANADGTINERGKKYLSM